MNVRLSVRKSFSSKGNPGFLVVGKYNFYQIKVFFDEESQAREYISRLKAGEDEEVILNDIWKIGEKYKSRE